MEEDQLSELLELLEPAAQPVTSRKGKRRAPAEEEDQQLEPSRARKGNSDGQWRVQEKYGFTHNMMALYEWASVVEGHPEFVECVTCTMVKNQPVRLQARPQTLKQHAETKGHKDSSGAAHRVAEVAAFQEAARAGNKASFDKAVAKADEEKLVQFKTCFHLLKHGRAMLQYEQALELLTALGVPKLPFMHWGDNAGWEVGGAINSVLINNLRGVSREARVVSLSLDEATATDGRPYMAVHMYRVEDWVRVPYFVDLKEVLEVPTAENLLATLHRP